MAHSPRKPRKSAPKSPGNEGGAGSAEARRLAGVAANPSTAQGATGRTVSPEGGASGGVDDADDDTIATRLLRIQQEFAEYTQGNSENVTRGAHDDAFLVGLNHWTEDQLRDRKQNERPSLVVNAVNLPYFQVTNDIRQNLPQPNTIPDDDDAHEETARILQGLWRHMNFRCNGNEKRLQAVNHAVSGGYGYYGLRTCYARERGFELDMEIRGVHNRALIVDDPNATEVDRRDRRSLFVCGAIGKREYKKRFPHNNPDPSMALIGIPEQLAALWGEKDVPVIEYWWREIKAVHTISDAGEEDYEEDVVDEETGEVLETRKAKRPREKHDDDSPAMLRDVVEWCVKGCLTNGSEILSDRRGKPIEWTLDLPWIPWFLVQGWTVNLAGEWHYEGVFHQAVDAQKLRDYGYTAIAEDVGQKSKVTVMGPEGTFENFEQEWAQRNKRPFPYLYFAKTYDKAGNLIAPMLVPTGGDPSAAIALTQQSTQMLRDGTGMYPVEQGGSPNDASGTMKSPMLPGAMRQQRTEGDMNHYHFMAGLAVAMKFEMECFLWLAPKVYGAPNRVQRILGADGTEKNESVTLNQPQPDPDNPEQDLPVDDPRNKAYTEEDVPADPNQPGVTKKVKGYNLNVGKYGCRIEIGPSFATQREQNMAFLQGMQQALGPGAAPLIAPFLIEQTTIQGKEKLARGFMAMLPANIQAALSDKGLGEEDANQLRARLAQLMPIAQQMAQTIQMLEGEVKDKRGQQAIEVMKVQQKYINETIQAIASLSKQQMASEADLLKDFVASARGEGQKAQRSAQAVDRTGAVSGGAQQRIEQTGAPLREAGQAGGGGGQGQTPQGD